MIPSAGKPSQHEMDAETLSNKLLGEARRAGVRQDHSLYAVVLTLSEAVRYFGSRHASADTVILDAVRRIEVAVSSTTRLTEQQVERARLETAGKLSADVAAGVERTLACRADTDRYRLWLRTCLTGIVLAVCTLSAGFLCGRSSALAANEETRKVMRADIVNTDNLMVAAFSDGSRGAQAWANLMRYNKIEEMISHCSQERNTFTDHGRRACSPSLWIDSVGQPDRNAAPW